MTLHCVVVGAGAWGLPAAAELAGRGHRVALIDRYGPINALSSSAGSTRLWRLADLAEGRAADADVAAWSSARFAAGMPAHTGPHALGRH